MARALQAKRFGITSTPVGAVPRIGEYDRAGDRTLSDEELRHYYEQARTTRSSVRQRTRCRGRVREKRSLRRLR